MKKKESEVKVELKLHSSYQLAHFQNVTNVAMALSQSGFFVNIGKADNGWYQIDIYIRN